jgi:hypothetical protein
VLVEGDDELMNRLVQARITKVESGKVFAKRLFNQ